MRFEIGTNNFTEGVTVVAPVTGYIDATPNSSNKTFTVPAGEMWKMTGANVTLVTTATAGNRQIRFQVEIPIVGAIGYTAAGATQGASLTRQYGFLQGTYRETAFIDGMMQVPYPMDLYLRSGSVLRFYDSAAIDPAADDMTIVLGLQRFKGA